MKTAIFLNTFTKMGNYDLEELSKYGFKLIAIVHETDYSSLQEKYAKYFSKIYLSPKPENIHADKVNYAFAKDIVAQYLKKGDDIRIICQSEDNLLLAGQLRDDFNISGMGYKKTQLFRDKVLMKQALKAGGVRIPKFAQFILQKNESLSLQYDKLAKEFGLPFVLKPTKLLGGIGVAIIHRFEDFSEAAKMDFSGLEYEVEEFITGKLYHFDAIRNQGKEIFSVCCQYTNPNFDFQLEKSVVSIPLQKDDPIARRLAEFNKQVLSVLQFETGVTHLEVFVTPNDEIVFLEIGARSPGAIVTPMYRRAFNIGFEDTDFKIQMEVPFHLVPTYDCYYMSGILPILPGKVERLVKPQLHSEFDLQWLVKVGEVLGPCKSLRDKAGTIIVWNNDYQALWEDFNYLKNFQCISTAANEARKD